MISREIKRSFFNLLSLAGAQILGIPLSFLSVLILSRFLGPDGYGKLALVISVAMCVHLFALNWTSSALVPFGKEELARENSIRNTFWAQSFILWLCWLGSTALLFLCRSPLSSYAGIKSEDFWILPILTLGIAGSAQARNLLQALGSMQWFALLSMLDRAMLAVFLLLYVLSGFKLSILAALLAFLISKILQAFLGIAVVKKSLLLPIAFTGAMLKRILAYSWPYVFAFTAGYTVDWIDLWVIKIYFSFKDVGTYQVAYQAMLAFSSVLMTVSTLFFPIISTLKAEQRNELVKRILNRISPQMIFIWSLFLALVSTASPFFFTIAFGTRFSGAVVPFRILLVGIAFQCITVMYSPVLASYERVKESSAIGVLMALINLIGDLLLIPRIGIAGAAVSTAISYATAAFFYLRVGDKRLSVNIWASLLCPIPAALVLFTILLSGSLILQAVLVTGIFIASLVTARQLGLFEKEDAAILERVEMPHAFRRGLISVLQLLAKDSPLVRTGGE